MNLSSGMRRLRLAATPPPRDEVEPSLFAGRYRLAERLGRGGMGEVWDAFDEKLRRTVALKLLRRDLVRDPDSRARFLREMYAVALLESDHMVTLYDFGVDPEPYMAMQRLHGPTLRQEIQNNGRIELDLAVCYAIHVAYALDAAHKAGLIHRDIKPENVVIGQKKAVLLDLGIAQDMTAAQRGEASDRLGTLGYITPEMVNGEPADPRSDLFQLGILLYEMLTGQKPWKGMHKATDTEVQLAHATEDPEPLPLGVSPAPLSRVIFSLLEKRKEDRPASAEQVIEELCAAMRPSTEIDPAAARMVREQKVKRRLARLTAAAQAQGLLPLSRPITAKSKPLHIQRQARPDPEPEETTTPRAPAAPAAAEETTLRRTAPPPARMPAMRAPFPLAMPAPDFARILRQRGPALAVLGFVAAMAAVAALAARGGIQIHIVLGTPTAEPMPAAAAPPATATPPPAPSPTPPPSATLGATQAPSAARPVASARGSAAPNPAPTAQRRTRPGLIFP